MRILVITRSPWSDNNNTGNTMTNFFSGLDNDSKVFNLYFRSELPNNTVVDSSFQITEIQLINNIIKRQSVGTVVGSSENNQEVTLERKMYKKGLSTRSYIPKIIREIIWSAGNWKNSNLDSYLAEINPDIIFMSAFDCIYPYKVLFYVQKITNAKVVMFHTDNNYTLKQLSFSPLFWVYHFIERKYYRHSIEVAKLNYCISELQKKEYTEIFNKEFGILAKTGDFTKKLKKKITNISEPLKLIYTGNIDKGRKDSLNILVNALKVINKDNVRAKLFVYTRTPDDELKTTFSVENCSEFCGAVENSSIKQIQSDADILVFAEGMDLKSELRVCQSFSTKLVDYFLSNRCIFAIGTNRVSAIYYLLENDAAIVVSNYDDVVNKLTQLIDNRSLVEEYADKAWNFGKKNHNTAVREKFYNDLKAIIN